MELSVEESTYSLDPGLPEKPPQIDEGYGSMPIIEKENVQTSTTTEPKPTDIAPKFESLALEAGWKDADIGVDSEEIDISYAPVTKLRKWPVQELVPDMVDDSSSTLSSRETQTEEVAIPDSLVVRQSSLPEIAAGWKHLDPSKHSNASFTLETVKEEAGPSAPIISPQVLGLPVPITKIPILKAKKSKSWFKGDVIQPFIKRLYHHSEKKGEEPKPITPSKKSPLLLRRLYQVVKEKARKTSVKVSQSKKIIQSLTALEISNLEQSKFERKYRVGVQIGSGGHAAVKLATELSSGKQVVCKFINAVNVWHWTPAKVPLEITMMKEFTAKGHPGFIKYIEHFTMGEEYVIVMEYLGKEWMDLYDYIETFGPVKETHTKDIFKQVVDVISYMHNLGYSHNDIKDENIMIHTASRRIKLIDFGSTMKLQRAPVAVFYGTHKFACPEALQTKIYNLYSQEVWAMGTLLYVLLFKMDPFGSDTEVVDLDISKRIKRLSEGSDTLEPMLISDDAKNLLIAMLHKDWTHRPEVSNISQFAFIKS